jgi:hypothetical protein
MLTSTRPNGRHRGAQGLALWLGAWFSLSVAAPTASLPDLLGPSVVHADDVAEATMLFNRGNEHFQRAMRLRGPRRRRELELALEQYLQSLGRVRSRNVLYNTALVLEALDRAPEAFNHWTEYLAVDGLSEQELADGRQHRDALRIRVAVFVLRSSTPAEVWIDRRDLGSRGRTPLEVALEEGQHTFYFAAAGHSEGQMTASGALGGTTDVTITLEAQPVWVQVLAPEGAILEIDGGRVTPGQSVPIPPGAHVARVASGERTLAERRFEVLVGSAPMVIDMTSALGAGGLGGGLVHVVVNTAAQLEIDGVVQGQDASEHETTLSPGPHRVRVSAPGRRTYEGSPNFELFPARLEVSLAEGGNGWVYAGRGVFGPLAILGIVTGSITLVGASVTHDRNQRERSQDSADALQGWTLATDITWSITAALGVATIALLIVDPGGGDSTATFSVQPAPGGGTASLTYRFGGAL